MSGLLHVKLARAKGCTVTATDVNPARLALAKGFGAVENNQKAGAVIVCTSALAAIDHAWKSVDKGGVVVFFAVPGPEKQVVIPINDFWTKEIRVLTSYYCGPDDIIAAMEMLDSSSLIVDDLITHRLPLEETAKGFQLVLEGRESIKVIIKPHPGDK
jgi:L-iditol 2-dehydrogenase